MIDYRRVKPLLYKDTYILLILGDYLDDSLAGYSTKPG